MQTLSKVSKVRQRALSKVAVSTLTHYAVDGNPEQVVDACAPLLISSIVGGGFREPAPSPALWATGWRRHSRWC